jgi:FkbH-like protein
MNPATHAIDRLSDLSQQFLSSEKTEQAPVLKTLLTELRQAITEGRHGEAAAALRQVIVPSLDYSSALSLHRIRKDLRGKAAMPASIRLAVLGGFTTTQIAGFIDLALFALGIDAEIYESDFGVFRQEILDPTSGLHEFHPQVVWLGVSRRDIGHRPTVGSRENGAVSFVETERQEWAHLWSTLNERVGCHVIQNNFVLPPWRSCANYEMREDGTVSRFVADLNRAMSDATPPYVTIHDVDYLAAAAGRWTWEDPRFIHHAKLPCAPEHLFDYAHNLSSLIGVQLGVTKKCLVLDLDNTLWGGVVGDDGLGGIRLGHGTAEGEAFLAFQEYAKALQQRGILLAVCSKNNEDTARDVFLNHSEMLIRVEDVSSFKANWTDKPTNLRAIASELNIGLQSMVFVDDNPAERAIVRQLLPEVSVPELPEDASGYVEAIERHRFFQTLTIAAEDLQRVEYYRADALRREVQTSTADIEAFLKSLNMVGHISPVTAANLERTAQLIQRSNQFNLTTRRYAAGDLLRRLADPSSVSATVPLGDRFGDNGLISVALAAANGDALEIDLWLMSCRVLKRGVEHSLLNHLCAAAKARGLRILRGEYIPTAKNAMVRRHYAELGFTEVAGDDTGRTVWELNLDGWTPFPHFIHLEAPATV